MGLPASSVVVTGSDVWMASHAAGTFGVGLRDRNYLRNTDALRAVGFSESTIREIRNAPSVAVSNAILAVRWHDSAARNPESREAVAAQARMAAKARGVVEWSSFNELTPGAYLNMDPLTKKWTVHGEDGTVVVDNLSLDAAASVKEAMDSESEAAQTARANARPKLTKPNRLGIVLDDTLPPEQYAAQVKFADELNSRTDAENDARYDEIVARKKEGAGGIYLNTDFAREMSDDYKSNPGEFSQATHAAASRYIHQRFLRELNNPEIKDVVFLAGGAAAGKSSTGVDSTTGTLIYDSTLRDADGALSDIVRSLTAGKKVQIVYVWAPIEKAVDRADARAKMEGRVVTSQSMGSSHFGSQQTIISLLEKSNGLLKDVGFKIVDNSGVGIGSALPMGFSSAQQAANATREEKINRALDFLRNPDIRYRDENTVTVRAINRRGMGSIQQGTGRRDLGVSGPSAGNDQGGQEAASGGSVSPSKTGANEGSSGSRKIFNTLTRAQRRQADKRLAKALDSAGVQSRFDRLRRMSRFRRAWIDATSAVQDFVKYMGAHGVFPATVADNPDTLVRRFRRIQLNLDITSPLFFHLLQSDKARCGNQYLGRGGREDLFYEQQNDNSTRH